MVYQIQNNVYQGGRPTDKDWENFGADWAVICLEEAAPQPPPETKVTCILHMPIVDGPFPGNNWLSLVVAIIRSMINNGKKVYIHCAAGISRSVMVTAAYLMEEFRYDLDAAMELIAVSNKRLDPSAAFLRGLKNWRVERCI